MVAVRGRTADKEAVSAPRFHLRPDDVRPAGRVPNNTAIGYAIFEDGEQIGQVNFQGAFAMMSAGEDVPTFLADTLNGYATRMDESDLRTALADVLSL